MTYIFRYVANRQNADIDFQLLTLFLCNAIDACVVVITVKQQS